MSTGIKEVAPSSALNGGEQGMPDVDAAAPAGVKGAASAVRETAAGAFESAKEAAPSNVFGGFFGGTSHCLYALSDKW